MLLYLSGVFATLVVLATQSGAVAQSISLQQQRHLRDEAPSDWPSLRFHFKVKRDSMDIYGHTGFSLIANPVVSGDDTSVLYDVFAKFKEGTSVYNYTRVDGVAYVQTTETTSGTSTTQCLPPDMNDFPPINAIISSLSEARPASKANSSIKCNGSMFKVVVNALNFILCASGNGFKMYGHDMDITVSYREDRVNIVAPKSDGDCEAEEVSSSVSLIGRALLTGTKVPKEELRNLEAELSIWSDDDDDDDASCSCKSTPRPCIFIHGLGVKAETLKLEDSLPYWGKHIQDHAPCCSSIKFAHLNTVNYTWLNGTQQQQVCNRALAVSNSSTKRVIKDTIVVTHSMGSLMLAGAIAHGRCKLDPSSTWVSTAAPMIGSMAPDYAQKVCAGDTNLIAEKLADFKDQCPVQQATKSLAYMNGSYSTPRLNKAYKIAQEVYRTNVSAVMCSESYSGILSSYQASFWILGEMIPHKSSKNDGTVEFDSCATGLDVSEFGDTYKSRFYRTKLNHYDMQFRGGDAFWNKAKMPVKWFECLL
ncbi:hypothetical protein PC121_g14361 [Phytophthora cactorum]|nr:hypothetical protein PC120_g24073 [Phytophthora cactorum]KAG3058504.1 hypothetical protein PC121_g14361 [Phytophthora cactorum]KAG4039829.1 hypothetical protein PC123_g24618 [Phytophthora cactorum]